ncbi:MAG: hypothetical protein ABIR55_08875 [Burkholderiaceae bacterium]
MTDPRNLRAQEEAWKVAQLATYQIAARTLRRRPNLAEAHQLEVMRNAEYQHRAALRGALIALAMWLVIGVLWLVAG